MNQPRPFFSLFPQSDRGNRITFERRIMTRVVFHSQSPTSMGRARTLLKEEQAVIMEFARQGSQITEIAKHLNHSRNALRKFLTKT